MWTLTITLKSTRHQIVLGYETKESMSKAWLNNKAGENHVEVVDDFGQTAYYSPENLVSLIETDMESHEDFRVARQIADTKAENTYQKALGQDPTLSFLVGGQNPAFLRRK